MKHSKYAKLFLLSLVDIQWLEGGRLEISISRKYWIAVAEMEETESSMTESGL